MRSSAGRQQPHTRPAREHSASTSPEPPSRPVPVHAAVAASIRNDAVLEQPRFTSCSAAGTSSWERGTPALRKSRSFVRPLPTNWRDQRHGSARACRSDTRGRGRSEPDVARSSGGFLPEPPLVHYRGTARMIQENEENKSWFRRSYCKK